MNLNLSSRLGSRQDDYNFEESWRFQGAPVPRSKGRDRLQSNVTQKIEIIIDANDPLPTRKHLFLQVHLKIIVPVVYKFHWKSLSALRIRWIDPADPVSS